MTKSEFIAQFDNILRIKKGGQKVVYKATTKSGDFVAVKLIYNAEDPRIQQEIDILTKMQILNTPRILETGYIQDDEAEENALYIIEEFIDGQSLRDQLNSGKRYNLTEAYNLLEKLLIIEIDLESKSLLHRDINPNNIMLSDDLRVTLIDFGLAKNLKGKALTDTNALNGPFTPGYAPNEQVSNKRMEQDVRTDLFQIGVTIYECCNGSNPFCSDNDTIYDVLHKTTTYNPPLLKLQGDTKGMFAQLIAMLMAKNSSQRPDSANAANRYLKAIKSTLTLEEK